jgi:hypothetical protein
MSCFAIALLNLCGVRSGYYTETRPASWVSTTKKQLDEKQ